MSSGKSDKIFQTIDNSHEKAFNQNIDFSKIVIPFSKIIGSFNPRDIYSGNENIPFKEREPEFRMILRQEFSNLLKI